jgi:hypothetical protein
MTDHAPIRRNLCRWSLAACLVAGAGCRTDSEDVHRWANTQQGPRKLMAVMTHEKYMPELRIEAAMTLVRMKPRAGRRVGIDELIAGLADLPAARRSVIVSGMVPLLVAEIKKPPPPAPAAGATREPDTTFPYKDAAFALLTNEGEELVSDKQQRQALESALSDWVMADFSARMDDSSQAYGIGQLLAQLGAEGVRRLPQLIVPEAQKIGNIAGFIADFGDAQTKQEASQRLVKVAQEVDSDAWLKRKAPGLKEANEASGQKVEGARFEMQLALYQEEELLRVLSSLKQVGQAPAMDYLLSLARNKTRNEKRREAALAAMEGHVDRKNTALADGLLELASAEDTPDSVRDQALRRVGELPRKQVIGALYGLFTQKNWKIRWVAAELVLRTSESQHIAEFMTKLGGVRNMAITEPLRYGKLIAGVQGTPPARDVIKGYTAPQYPAPVRLTALSYYLDQGTRDQLPLVDAYKADATRVPECVKDAEGCEWQCEIASGGEQVVKPVKTIGEFVEYCVKPAMQARATAESAAAQAKN